MRPKSAVEFPCNSERAELPATVSTSSGLRGASESVHTPPNLPKPCSTPRFITPIPADPPSVPNSIHIDALSTSADTPSIPSILNFGASPTARHSSRTRPPCRVQSSIVTNRSHTFPVVETSTPGSVSDPECVESTSARTDLDSACLKSGIGFSNPSGDLEDAESTSTRTELPSNGYEVSESPGAFHSVPISLSTPSDAPGSPLSVRDPVRVDPTSARSDSASAHPKAGIGTPASTCDSGCADSAVTHPELPSVVETVNKLLGAFKSLPAPSASSIRDSGALHSSCDITFTPSTPELDCAPDFIDSVCADSLHICTSIHIVLKVVPSIITPPRAEISNHSSPEHPWSELQVPHPPISLHQELWNMFLHRSVPAHAHWRTQ